MKVRGLSHNITTVRVSNTVIFLNLAIYLVDQLRQLTLANGIHDVMEYAALNDMSKGRRRENTFEIPNSNKLQVKNTKFHSNKNWMYFNLRFSRANTLTQ